MEQFPLWRRTLGFHPDDFPAQREILRQALLGFRERTAQLVAEISGQLPGLTVHDITHLDALWRIADEIAGPDYPLNAAEAFVLGGAFLLHDAAHAVAAYPEGVAGIRKSTEWKDLIAQRFEGKEPAPGSPAERSALFQVLRHLHAKQAHALPRIAWKVPGTDTSLHLLEHTELRLYYGDIIGKIAESHHWPAHRVADELQHWRLNAPAFLAPANWVVDALKVAFLLRTADAAHIDAKRAPWFLFALRRPEGISELHWRFQAKLGQPTRTEHGELRLSSGDSFTEPEHRAWWLAYDTACMIDRELRDAQTLMLECGRQPFAASSLAHVATPEAFARYVRTSGWEPVNVAPKIGDVPAVIKSLGGPALYGDNPELALREILQNAADAIRALRSLGRLEPKEGRIDVALARSNGESWLHVTDTGIGMSRFVLTNVLLDFGRSLWSSEALRSELPGLASSGFRSVGRFGIGFFSVFMLGQRVRVTTRRFRKAEDESSDQWVLEFDSGVDGRPSLRKPRPEQELAHPGTRVSVVVNDATLTKLLYLQGPHTPWWQLGHGGVVKSIDEQLTVDFLTPAVARLCPSLDIEVRTRINDRPPVSAVRCDDWETLDSAALIARLYRGAVDKDDQMGDLVDLREPSGELVGRATLGSHYGAKAVVTHRGLRNGDLEGLVGVVLGHNNNDLARTNSTAIASAEAWSRWAQEVLKRAMHADRSAIARLHPLVAAHDLPVFMMGSSHVDLKGLRELAASRSELLAYPAYPNARLSDDVPPARFRKEFKPREDVLFWPTGKPISDLADQLGLPSVDYRLAFETVLRETWKLFTRETFQESIGDVNGTRIMREVTRYRRRQVALRR